MACPTSALGLDDYAGLDVRGKIVVVLGGTPDGLPSEIAAHLGSDKDARRGGAWRGRHARDRRTPRAPRVPPAPRGQPLFEAPGDRLDRQGGQGRATPPGSVRVTLSASRAMAGTTVRGRAQVARRGARRGRDARAFARAASRFARALSIRSESAWEDFKSPEVIAKLPGADPRACRRTCRPDGPSRPSRPRAPTPSPARTRSTMARSTMPPGSRR